MRQGYELEMTEYNGEHQYTYNYFIFAENETEANKIAYDWGKTWYGDLDVEDIADEEDKKSYLAIFEFWCGSIILRLEYPCKTSKAKFIEKQFNKYFLGVKK